MSPVSPTRSRFAGDLGRLGQRTPAVPDGGEPPAQRHPADRHGFVPVAGNSAGLPAVDGGDEGGTHGIPSAAPGPPPTPPASDVPAGPAAAARRSGRRELGTRCRALVVEREEPASHRRHPRPGILAEQRSLATTLSPSIRPASSASSGRTAPPTSSWVIPLCTTASDGRSRVSHRGRTSSRPRAAATPLHHGGVEVDDTAPGPCSSKGGSGSAEPTRSMTSLTRAVCSTGAVGGRCSGIHRHGCAGCRYRTGAAGESGRWRRCSVPGPGKMSSSGVTTAEWRR